MSDTVRQPDDSVADSETRFAALEAELEALKAELADVLLLYDVTTEHGEAVENQLAESNRVLEETQARLSEELSEAANYIMSILPPPRQDRPRTRWLLEPSTELGGDSFGYHDIDADHTAFYLLDVCGHGVGAALLSVTAINVLRSSALPNTDFRDPGRVLTALNDAFPMERQNNMYFTIWYGVFQRSSNTMRYASAGHPPAVLKRADGTVEQLSTPSIAVGMMPEAAYRCRPVTLREGDLLHILSDGTFEVETRAGEMLAFADFVDHLVSSGSPEDLLGVIRGLNGSGPPPDDFSLLSIEF